MLCQTNTGNGQYRRAGYFEYTTPAKLVMQYDFSRVLDEEGGPLQESEYIEILLGSDGHKSMLSI